MTSGHFIFIPLILIAGTIIGFVLGGRVARDAFNHELVRERQREEAKRAREERKRKRADASKNTDAEEADAETD